MSSLFKEKFSSNTEDSMTPEQIEDWAAILLSIIGIEVFLIILLMIIIKLTAMWDTIPETAYYFKNCNNLTLFPQGCQVLS